MAAFYAPPLTEKKIQTAFDGENDFFLMPLLIKLQERQSYEFVSNARS